MLNEGQKLQLNKPEPHSPCITRCTFIRVDIPTHFCYYKRGGTLSYEIFLSSRDYRELQKKEKTHEGGDPNENNA